MASHDYDYNFRLLFQATWFDPVASLKKNFLLSFYPCDNTVELYDIALKKTFLRRSSCESLRMKDVFVGNRVNIYDRLIVITEYGDANTRNFIGRLKEHTIALIKPSGMPHLGEILDEIFANDYTIERMRMVHLNRVEVLKLYEEYKDNPQLPFIVEHLSSGPSVALELVGENAIAGWRKLMGPTDPQEARRVAPATFRARYGTDVAGNVVHGSDNYEQAVQNACFFFPQGIDAKPPATTVRIKNSTCCIVKPHAIDEGNLGQIIKKISKEFQVTAIQMYFMSQANIEEFLEVYKGVVANFHAFMHSFINGPCIALEISAKEEDSERDVHKEFRAFCGPLDSDIAKQIRPNTLRGMFGIDKYKNAVHCTDLPEDTTLELEYFFKILDES